MKTKISVKSIINIIGNIVLIVGLGIMSFIVGLWIMTMIMG